MNDSALAIIPAFSEFFGAFGLFSIIWIFSCEEQESIKEFLGHFKNLLETRRAGSTLLPIVVKTRFV